MTTLSTLGQNDFLRYEFASLQDHIQQLQTQVGTGERAQRYGDLGAEAPVDIGLRNQATILDNYKTSINQLTLRTSMIDKSLVIINDTATAVQNQAFQSPSFPAQRQNLVAAAKAAIDQITQQLRASVDGRNLFGGTQTQVNPIVATATLLPTVQAAVAAAIAGAPPNVPAAIQAAVSGGAGVMATAASYYVGGPAHAPTQVDPNLSVDYSIIGGDPAFLTILQGLYTIASLPQPVGSVAAPPNLSDSQFDATATAAATTIAQGLAQMQTLTVKNGRNEMLLQQQSDAHAVTLTVLQGQINNIESVDIADATTRLTQYRTQLDASYRITASLSSLNLVDFLK